MTVEAERTPVGADNSVFRRGLILGLTLAEISLLLVFVLLLVFGGLLKKAQVDLARQAEAERRAAAAEAQLQKTLSSFAPNTPAQQVDEWVEELIASSVRASEVEALRGELAQASSALERVESAIARAGLTQNPAEDSEPKAFQERWEQVVADVEAASGELRAGQIAAKAIAAGGKGEAAKAVMEARLEAEQLQGAVANAQRKLEAAGKGTEKPACWATKEGRPEYIFEITLSSGGMRIHDRALPHRKAQQAILPLSSIHFDQTVSPSDYRRQTRPLFDWGEARGCRFFVVAVDGTGAAEKQVFKQRLRVMEEHFYKFLAN